jgi:DNA-binding response OmpR family regulator
MRLLMVEDSARLSSLTASGLAKHGFETDIVTTVADALAALTATHFSAIILELGLPDGDGLSIVQFLRDRSSPTPVLILTARQSVGDRIKGLRRGADDYLGKPFAFEELVARLQALLRRPGTYLSDQLTLADLFLDVASCEITVDGSRHAISPREARVLEMLMRRSNRVVPKKVLEDELYGLAADGSANAVEAHISRLRKQLLETRAKLQIYTVRGVGYLIKEAPGE